MKKVEVKVVREKNVTLPKYETEGSAGLDVRANIIEPIVLKSLERVLIPTGLKIAIPEGYEVQVRPRSGLAIKHGITMLNSPGTIDSDYRGEIKVIAVNLSNETYTIEPNERIKSNKLNLLKLMNWMQLIVVKVASDIQENNGELKANDKFIFKKNIKI